METSIDTSTSSTATGTGTGTTTGTTTGTYPAIITKKTLRLLQNEPFAETEKHIIHILKQLPERNYILSEMIHKVLRSNFYGDKSISHKVYYVDEDYDQYNFHYSVRQIFGDLKVKCVSSDGWNDEGFDEYRIEWRD